IQDTVGMSELYAGNFIIVISIGVATINIGIAVGAGRRDFCSRRSLLPANLMRRFVFTQTFERRVAENAIARPAGEDDFADQLRLDPVHPFCLSSDGRFGEWRRILPELIEPVAASAWAISLVRFFGNDAFNSHFTCLFEKSFALADPVFAASNGGSEGCISRLALENFFKELFTGEKGRSN